MDFQHRECIYKLEKEPLKCWVKVPTRSLLMYNNITGKKRNEKPKRAVPMRSQAESESPDMPNYVCRNDMEKPWYLTLIHPDPPQMPLVLEELTMPPTCFQVSSNATSKTWPEEDEYKSMDSGQGHPGIILYRPSIIWCINGHLMTIYYRFIDK